jgi:hypothetical protein
MVKKLFNRSVIIGKSCAGYDYADHNYEFSLEDRI